MTDTEANIGAAPAPSGEVRTAEPHPGRPRSFPNGGSSLSPVSTETVHHPHTHTPVPVVTAQHLAEGFITTAEPSPVTPAGRASSWRRSVTPVTGSSVVWSAVPA